MQVRRAIAGTLGNIRPEEIRVPARGAAFDCYLPDARDLRAEAFGTLLGAPLVASVCSKNGRLRFDLTDAFFDACVAHVNAALPLPTGDCGDHALNRLLCLSRRGGSGCPRIPAVQRALWLCAGATESPALADRAAHACLTMLHDLPAAERQLQLQACGAAAAAAARLYARIYCDVPAIVEERI